MQLDSMRLMLVASLVAIACSGAHSGTDGAGGRGGSGGLGAGGAGPAAAGSNPASSGAGNTAAVLGQSGTAGSAQSGAGASGQPGGAGGGMNALNTWNSAKSAMVSDAMLEREYSAWKAAHAEACPGGGSWVVVKDGAVVSEGIAYGMLLSAAMNDQPLFDGLWKYYQDHVDKNGLMNWATAKCEAPGDNKANAATDGDLDAAMALVQAAARWPSGSYLAQASALASKIAQFETDLCSGRSVLKPGDAFGGCSDTNDKRINPSYFAPGYYQVFAHYFPEQAATWTALSDGSFQLYAGYQARMSNLVPDWSGPDGSDNGASYGYDACRTPWRVAVDYAWTGDPRAKTFLQNISSWVDGHGGLPSAAQQQNSAFIGAFALAGGYEQAKFDGYMAGWLGAKMDDTPYFQGTLRVLYLLVAAGKFSSTL